MIPEFNKDGNLPEGIYSASEEEFLDRFATNSSRRKWLGERLKEMFCLSQINWKAQTGLCLGEFCER